MPLNDETIQYFTKKKCMTISNFTQASSLEIEVNGHQHYSVDHDIAIYELLSTCLSLKSLYIKVSPTTLNSWASLSHLMTALRHLAPALTHFHFEINPAFDWGTDVDELSPKDLSLVPRAMTEAMCDFSSIAERFTSLNTFRFHTYIADELSELIENEIKDNRPRPEDFFVLFFHRLPYKGRLQTLEFSLSGLRLCPYNYSVGGDLRVKYFIAALNQCSSLQTFNLLNANYVNDKVFGPASRFIMDHRHLKIVNLSFDCSGLDLMGLITILQNKTLKELSFSDSVVFESSAISTLRPSIKSQIALLGRAIETHRGLKYLYLDVNEMVIEHAITPIYLLNKLALPIFKNSSIESLIFSPSSWISGGLPAVCHLKCLQELHNNTRLINFGSDDFSSGAVEPILKRNQHLKNNACVMRGLKNFYAYNTINFPDSMDDERKLYQSLICSHRKLDLASWMQDSPLIKRFVKDTVHQFLNMLPPGKAPYLDDTATDIACYLEYKDLMKLSNVTGGFFYRKKKELDAQQAKLFTNVTIQSLQENLMETDAPNVFK